MWHLGGAKLFRLRWRENLAHNHSNCPTANREAHLVSRLSSNYCPTKRAKDGKTVFGRVENISLHNQSRSIAVFVDQLYAVSEPHLLILFYGYNDLGVT